MNAEFIRGREKGIRECVDNLDTAASDYELMARLCRDGMAKMAQPSREASSALVEARRYDEWAQVLRRQAAAIVGRP